jgi:hypothetical protein
VNLKAIATYLQAQGLGVQGTSLFVHEMPADCRQGILLIGPGAPIDHYLPGYITAAFRLVARHTDIVAGEQLARDASQALTMRQEQQLSGILVKQLLPQTEPTNYRRSVGGYWESEVEFDIYYVNT